MVGHSVALLMVALNRAHGSFDETSKHVKNMPLNIKRSDRGTTEPASNSVSHDDHFEGVSL